MGSFITWMLYQVEDQMGGNVARMGEVKIRKRIVVGKHEGKRPLGRPRRRWEDNIKMDLKEIGKLWTRFKWRPLVNTVMEFRLFETFLRCS
jgi:hypothetical protein